MSDRVISHRLAAVLHRAGRLALDALLPRICLTCEALIDDAGWRAGGLCAECLERATFLAGPCCDACGVGLGRRAAGTAPRLCPVCRLAPPPWDRARAALRYDGQARRLVLPLKYHDRVELAAALAPMMARAGAVLLREAEVIVPVPLHRRRLLWRRYNQAALLAHEVGRLGRLDVVADALLRTRATVPLGELSAAVRERTVAGAFAVRAGRHAAVVGRHVLLVDDVLTSGATCGACALALRAAGAVRVDVLAAARVPHPGFSDGDLW